MRKYLIILMVTTFIGGFAYLFLLSNSSLAVVINNHTDEEISGLSLTYEGIKTDIVVDPIAAEEDAVLKVDPETQASDSFEEGSLTLQYKDQNGKVHSETVFDNFDKESSGDAEVTIKSVDENGELAIDIGEYLVD